MSREDRLTAFGKQAGFTVRVASDTVKAVDVPCLVANGKVACCSIEKSFDPNSGKPDARTGGAIHAVRIVVDVEFDGLVYHADGNPIGNHVGGDGKTWSNISIKKGTPGNPEDDQSAYDLIHRYARQIVGAVSKSGYSEIPFSRETGSVQHT